jgi:hypothetical protein
MIDVKSKRCQHEDCKTSPTYNFDGQTKAIYCAKHKEDGMIDVKHKTCRQEHCITRPTYNFDGQTNAIFCGQHKEDGMIDVENKTCQKEECKTRPTYNFDGETKAIFCGQHKVAGMIDVKHKTCQNEDCKKQPAFNFNGQTKAIYCAKHKEDGMIDVKNKTCQQENCKTIPNFNFDGQTKTIYCGKHKHDGMINVKNKSCVYEWCQTQVSNSRYEGYCLRCFMYTFPDKPISRNYKTKEVAVVDFVKKTFPDFTWISDKKVNGGCSRRRPDLFLDLGDQIIIIEVDENKHESYDCSCENKRIMELSQDVGHVPIVFIRFNPDAYKLNQVTVTSCWGINKLGFCVVRKTKTAEWTQRLQSLETQIEYWAKHRTDKVVETVQLFFDA